MIIKSLDLSLNPYFCKHPQTTDTQWRHKSKISEKLGRCGRQNMLRPYLKIWDWDWIFGRALKAIFSLGVRSPWSEENSGLKVYVLRHLQTFCFRTLCIWSKTFENCLETGFSWDIFAFRPFESLVEYYGFLWVPQIKTGGVPIDTQPVSIHPNIHHGYMRPLHTVSFH